MKKLIETTLPLKAIQSADVGDRAGISGHPANLHIWWGRTPIASTAAILKAAMLDEDPSIGKSIQDDVPDRGVTVFDPFAGFGGIPLAAQRLGLKSISGDLNPVAVMLNKAATEIPAQFAGAGPVHMQIEHLDGNGAQGLAADVAFYGQWMLRKAKERLRPLYPQWEGQDVQAWLWTRTVKCPNPACGCEIPLAGSYVLSSRTGRAAWAEPVIRDGELRFSVHAGPCPPDRVTNKFGNQGMRFRCISCGEITSDAYVKAMGSQHQIGSRLMAVMTEQQGKKRFDPPGEAQTCAADIPMPDAAPPGSIPDKVHCFRPPSFGYTEFAELYTPRQMQMLLTFSDLLREVQDKAASDALAAGMSPTGGTLGKGGTGALAYGEAISVYLALLVDLLAEYNACTCSWDHRSCTSRSAFRMQTIPMPFSFGEGNPLTDQTGGFPSLLKKLTASIAGLPGGAESRVFFGNAVTEPFPEHVMVCTELPYSKETGLAPLSDYFYIWLRRSLRHIYPELFSQTVTAKEELSAASEHYGAAPEQGRAQYEADLKTVCRKLYDCAVRDYPALMITAYRKEDALLRDSAVSAWESVLDGVLSAGFSISNLLPLWDKKAAERGAGARVLIVCRKGQEKRPGLTRREFVSSFKRAFPEHLEELFRNADPADRRIIAMGCGISIFSEYKAILNADGSRMSTRDALQIILQEIDGFFIEAHTEENDPKGSRED